jgi:hypothetical protein
MHVISGQFGRRGALPVPVPVPVPSRRGLDSLALRPWLAPRRASATCPLTRRVDRCGLFVARAFFFSMLESPTRRRPEKERGKLVGNGRPFLAAP